MNEVYPYSYFERNGLIFQQCAQCCLKFWHVKKTLFCGDAQCNGFEKKRISADLTVAQIHNIWIQYLKSLTLDRPIEFLPRANTALKVSNINFMCAGISAFERLLNPRCHEKVLERYSNAFYVSTQFCYRFDDLENTGITMRHSSGFYMLGVQGFESELNPFSKNWKQQWIDIITNFLTSLGFLKNKLYYHAQYWHNNFFGGNSVEFFYDGIEVGNVVFIGSSYESKMPTKKILDIGMGLERLASFFESTPYQTHRHYDTMRSYIVSIKDGIKPSKTGLGYNARRLVENLSQIIGADLETFDKLGEEVAENLSSICNEDFKQVLPLAKTMYIKEQERLSINDATL